MSDEQARPQAAVSPGIYRHYKGNLYEVIDCVRHSETREALTLYRALYGERGLWVRPTAMFSDMVIVDGKAQARFAKQPDQERAQQVTDAVIPAKAGIQK